MSAFKIPRGRVDEPSTAEMFDAALLRSIKIVHQGELVKGSPERLPTMPRAVVMTDNVSGHSMAVNSLPVPAGEIHPSWLP